MVKTDRILESRKTRLYFHSDFSELEGITGDDGKIFIITDENVIKSHGKLLQGYTTIVLKSGEGSKSQRVVNMIIRKLLLLKADRSSVIVGVGGGVVTDITGYVSSIYLRGVRFGFVPATLLAMADACIGGKNGVNVGMYKNIAGTINQPEFIIYDQKLLKSLDERAWRNGFAEIIKHAALKDVNMFEEIANRNISYYRNNDKKLEELVMKNALIKCAIVQADEFEKGERRILNFGHTLGHAIEKQMGLMHGDAVAVGMVFAGKLSEKIKGFRKADVLQETLKKYGLPVSCAYDKRKTFQIMAKDKKRVKDKIEFILLEEIGNAVTEQIELETLKALL